MAVRLDTCRSRRHLRRFYDLYNKQGGALRHFGGKCAIMPDCAWSLSEECRSDPFRVRGGGGIPLEYDSFVWWFLAIEMSIRTRSLHNRIYYSRDRKCPPYAESSWIRLHCCYAYHECCDERRWPKLWMKFMVSWFWFCAVLCGEICIFWTCPPLSKLA